MIEYVSIEGALVGMILVIVLIIRGFNVPYSLILGGFIGAILGGKDIAQSTTLLLEGAADIIPAVIRIMTSGVLVGVLIKSGASKKIGLSIVHTLENYGNAVLLLSITLATVFLTSLGIILDIAIMTVAPIALDIGKAKKLSKESILVALIGGGQAGTIISLNANTIVAMNAFKVPLTDLIIANIVPALGGILLTTIIASRIANKGIAIEHSTEQNEEVLPSLLASLTAPICIFGFMIISRIFDISVDPLILLPLSALIGCLAMKKIKQFSHFCTYGIHRISDIVLLLLGVGTLAGVIRNSEIVTLMPQALSYFNISTSFLAPIAGMLLSFATPAVTAAVTMVANSFSELILDSGVNGLKAAAMLQAGAIVFDHLPHGTLFHATALVMDMNIKQRMKTLHWETMTGLILVIISMALYH